MKKIKIGDREFSVSCHASCYRDYADIFNRNILKDLQITQQFASEQYSLSVNYKKEHPEYSDKQIYELIFNDTIKDLDEFIDCITRLCWICIYDNNKEIDCYEEWYQSLERLSLSDDWMMEVMALCANCFR